MDGRLRLPMKELKRVAQVRKARTIRVRSCSPWQTRRHRRDNRRRRSMSAVLVAGVCFEKAVRSSAPKWAQQERAELTPRAG